MNPQDLSSKVYSWRDAGDILQSISSLSRISKGRSPINLEQLKSRKTHNESSSAPSVESLENGPSEPEPSHSVHRNKSSIRERYHDPDWDRPCVSMGRGIIFEQIEHRLEPARAALDRSIYNELRELGLDFSNETIEAHWGNYNSTDNPFCDDDSTTNKHENDNSNQEVTTPTKVNENVIEEIDYVVNGLSRIVCSEEPMVTTEKWSGMPIVKTEDHLEEPIVKADECLEESIALAQESKVVHTSPRKQKKKPKCRNAVLLNLTCKRSDKSTSALVLQPPETYLKKVEPETSILNPLSPSFFPGVGCIFSEDDFPALT